MCRMFPAARLFTGSLMNHYNDLAIRKLQQLKKGKLFLRWCGIEWKSKQGNEIYLWKPNCQVKLIWKLGLWNFILVRVHIAEHPRRCFENEACLLEAFLWNEEKEMWWNETQVSWLIGVALFVHSISECVRACWEPCIVVDIGDIKMKK